MGMCHFGPGDKTDAELDQHCYSPEVAQRGCTDFLCCILFLAGLVAMGLLTFVALFTGNFNNFAGLPDSSGQVCGVSAAVANSPYLFFCLDPTAGISITEAKRKCVAECPTSISMDAPCGALAYPTRDYANMICLPTEAANLQDLQKTFQNHPSMKVLMEIANIPRAWKALLIVAVTSIVLAFLYLMFLRNCTCLVWVGLAGVIGISGLFGLYFLGVTLNGGADGVPSTGDTTVDLIIAISSLAIAGIFTCIVLCKRSAVEMATHCIKAACECIWEVKSLLFEPFVALAIRCIIFIFCCIGFLLVLSWKTDEATPDGGSRWSYAEWQYCVWAFYVFMICWILELCHATSQFVVAFAVEMWFFSDYNSQTQSKNHPGLTFVTIQAYKTAMFHHMGSLALGSFVIAVFRFVQLVLGLLTQAAEDSQNHAAACIMKVCNCCLECFKRCIEHLNKNAYMDIAMNGNSFCPAAYHAMSILGSNATAVMVLKGACWIFELAAIGSIVASGVGVGFVCIKTFPEYTEPTSANYIAEPTIVLAACGFVSLILALPFVIVFGQAADTILYCFAIDKKRNPEKTGVAKVAEGTFGWFTGLFHHGSHAEAGGRGGSHDESSAHPPETEALLKSLKR